MSHLVNTLKGDPRTHRKEHRPPIIQEIPRVPLFQEPGTNTIQILYYTTNTLLHNKHITGYKH